MGNPIESVLGQNDYSLHQSTYTILFKIISRIQLYHN
jgi:hypothetical protein